MLPARALRVSLVGSVTRRTRRASRTTIQIAVTSSTRSTFPHYPQLGLDCNELVATLLKVKDPRVKYVIWNEKIFGDEAYGKRNGRKAWTKYSANNHTAHMHVSINVENEDDDHAWDIGALGDIAPDEPAPAVKPVLKIGSTGEDVRLVQSLLMTDGIYGRPPHRRCDASRRSRAT